MVQALLAGPIRRPFARFVDRVVTDWTGLSGRLDIDLKWTPLPGEWVAPPPPGSPEAPPAAYGRSLFTAIQASRQYRNNSA